MSWLRFHLAVGLAIRLALIVYGDYHDKMHAVKYTDVDYFVVTDGAREVSEGGSPFTRHTYRYTPLLAWLLLPNVLFHESWGKLLFSLFDCVSAKLIHTILQGQGLAQETIIRCCLLWIYNPLSIGISTRGSAESILATLVLGCVLAAKRGRPITSGVLLGVATHFKLYPIIYSLPLYLALTPISVTSHARNKSTAITKLLPSRVKFRLVTGAAMGFLIPTTVGLVIYGEQYFEEGFLYHVSRVDTRHNFSVYFYLLYLAAEFQITGIGLATFVPQFALVVAIGWKYGNKQDLAFGMFCQTFAFVAYNKVVTSQYFVWYLLLLPLVVPWLNMTKRKAILLTILWFAAQASWLLPAYLLEFHAVSAFLPIWLEGLAFFCCCVGILISIISAYSPPSPPPLLHASRKNR